MNRTRFLVAAMAVAALPAVAAAQKPTTRRQAPIEIRGQVPTPQVVTVRPREVPSFSRQVLVPRFYDHDFWPDIQAPYQMVPERQITGTSVSDTLGTGAIADSSAQVIPLTGAPGSATPTPTMRPDSTSTPPAATPPAGSTPATVPPQTGTAPAPAKKP